jgi:hypothetical protein
MLVFTFYVGIYILCWYLHSMLVFTFYVGIYILCWYLHSMLVFIIYVGIYNLGIGAKDGIVCLKLR